MGKFIDLTNQKFSKLTVIERLENNKYKQATWRCICDCGTEITVVGKSLISGNTKSCGCYLTKDLVNQRFGRLIVISYTGTHKRGGSTWLCVCDCGNEVIVQGGALTSGATRSCGCYMKKMRAKANKKDCGEATFNQALIRCKFNAKQRNLEFNLSKNEFRELSQLSCYYCGNLPSNKIINKYGNGDFSYNGLDRIDNSKGYTIDNVVPCCAKCNTAKSDYTEKEFYILIKSIYEHQYSNE